MCLLLDFGHIIHIYLYHVLLLKIDRNLIDLIKSRLLDYEHLILNGNKRVKIIFFIFNYDSLNCKYEKLNIKKRRYGPHLSFVAFPSSKNREVGVKI